MDDPLLGLTLWQSQEAEKNKKIRSQQRGNKTKSKSKDISKSSQAAVEETDQIEDIPCVADSNRLHDETGITPNGCVNDLDGINERRGSSKSSSSSKNCFPCLTGLELDPKKELHSKHVQEEEEEDEKWKRESEERRSNSSENIPADITLSTSPLPQLQSCWLLRLFESNLFTMHLAIQYLYKERDKDVQIYLGKKLFSFDNRDVDFYLPELVNMYIHFHDLSPVLHKYFLTRCRLDVLFSLKLAWLLVAYISDKWIPTDELQRASRMFSLIKTEQIRPPPPPVLAPSDSELASRHSVCGLTALSKQHHRSLSASNGSSSLPRFSLTDQNHVHSSINMSGKVPVIGDLRSGQAFDAGCICDTTNSLLPGSTITHCQCSAPRLSAQDMFVQTLGRISNRILKYSTRSLRTNQLCAELSQFNLNLPARVCLPLYPPTHQVLRIPPSEAVVLNSKSKAPFLILVEVAEVEDTFLSPLLQKQLDVSLTCSGLSPEEAKAFIHSEGPSPANTRASSLPNLRCGTCLDRISLSSLDNLHVSIVEEEHEKNIEDEIEVSSEDRSVSFDTSSGKEDSDKEERDGSPVTFSVSDIRSRLSQEIQIPKRSFSRDPEDPSAAAMKEQWDDKVKRIKETSPYGHLPNWNLLGAIVKWGDDLRQELVCWQLLEQFKSIWKMENVPLWIRPYMVLVLSSEGGLIEPVCNAISLHQIKKECKGSLINYFKQEFGDFNSEEFLTARRNFVESCAGYCLICYIIQVKDRHNGNILLDSEGHLIHIDFGFILANSPGNNIRFESSPFKLTQEFVEVMGGIGSDMYQYFKILMLQGFLAARKHMDRIINIIEIMQTGSQLPCYGHGPTTVKQLRDRFHLNLTEEQLELHVNSMVESSMYSLTTKLYDGFQYFTNGIL